ncbi:MAG: methyltransferase [Bacteroides sp.]|nr:methyltransferase [Bacteroides sp.]
MKLKHGKDNKSALQAKFDAQKIAFGPIMFQAARALRNLGILNLIRSRRNEGIEMEEIASELNLSIYGVKVLLEAGLSLELVMVEENRFKLTKTGWYILKDELTKVNMDFTHDVNYQGMFSLEDSIRSGTPTGLKTFGEWDTVYEGLSQLPPQVQKSWFAFDHFYSDYSFSEVLPLVITPGVKQILDVGGNTGKFAIRCARWSEDVHITILDLPGQLDKAKANIEKEGLSHRITCMPLNLLDHSKSFPGGMDVIWMSQFLDCFSMEDIAQLLRRGKEAMTSSTSLFIMELLWDRQKFEASTYSLHATSLYFTNIANGNSQMYHSNDLLELIEQSGMIVADSKDDIGISHSLLKCTLKS